MGGMAELVSSAPGLLTSMGKYMARNLDNRLGKLEAAWIGPLMGRRAALISQLVNCIITTFKPEFIERCAGFFTDPLSVNAEDRARIEHMPIPDDLKAGIISTHEQLADLGVPGFTR
jgi:hypothetical protein